MRRMNYYFMGELERRLKLVPEAPRLLRGGDGEGDEPLPSAP